MTTTDHAVQRVTRSSYSTLYAKARPIVVRIAAGDLLQFREHGRRQWYDIAIDDVFSIAVKAHSGFRLCFVPGPKLQKGRK